MNSKKQKIEIVTQIGSFKKAKELLADLEVLNEKYDVLVKISIVPLIPLAIHE